MFQKQHTLLRYLLLSLCGLLFLSSCGNAAPTPAPTSSLLLKLQVEELRVGDSIAIVAEVKPLERANLEWSISGTAAGQLNTYTGAQVIYTAIQPGTDIIIVEGTTASGQLVQETVTLTVVARSAAVEESPAAAAHTPTPTIAATASAAAEASPTAVTLPTTLAAVWAAQPPLIDGRLDDPLWRQAQSLTYAVHPTANGSSSATVRLAWDADYLYAAFDVNDTQVESAASTPWDGDSVSLVLGGEEYRYSLPADRSMALMAPGANAVATLKDATTLDNNSDQDNGYIVEMQIPWTFIPVARGALDADFLSVDHDQNPGGGSDAPTLFSKISWDGDGRVDTTLRQIELRPVVPTPLTFLNLQDNGTVALNNALVGNVAAEITDDIWVMVQPLGNRLYPQTPCTGARVAESALQGNGRWEVHTRFGNEADTGAVFSVLLLTAAPSASQSLSASLLSWCQTGEFPGLTLAELPAGLIEYQRLLVTRSRDLYGPPPPLLETSLDGTATITSLNDGDSAPHIFVLSGTADPAASAIWILSYNPNGRFYPQSTNPCQNVHTVFADGRWQVPVSLGLDDEVGKPFHLYVVLADAEANAFFDQKQQEWCLASDYPGLQSVEMPTGIQVKAHIAVVRD
ncbi:MAG: hypothetical protein IAE79_14830 [Anaerolinea sp.]|nr:hypothetical protein [Anaerolinea sp.]